jgi:hypothetical protein
LDRLSFRWLTQLTDVCNLSLLGPLLTVSFPGAHQHSHSRLRLQPKVRGRRELEPSAGHCPLCAGQRHHSRTNSFLLFQFADSFVTQSTYTNALDWVAPGGSITNVEVQYVNADPNKYFFAFKLRLHFPSC